MANDFPSDESSVTGVAWPAVLAGAFVATAVSLSLLFLGSALGFAVTSPWHHHPSAMGFTAMSAIWLIIMQWVSSAFGGYLAGRLRTKWTRLHTDEVFFRDTANGFLTWAVATVVTALLVGSVVGSLAHAGGRMAEKAPEAAAGPEGVPPSVFYFGDRLYRSDHPATATEPAANIETTRILMNSIRNDGVIVPEDKEYLAHMIVARTGVSAAEAHRRVEAMSTDMADKEAKAKEMANAARKAAATASLFIFLSLLIGAFIASAAAAVGGRERDFR